MASSIFRLLGAVKDGLQAAGEIKAAHGQGLCVNCKLRPTAIIPATATSPATRALLCDPCGEKAANGSAQVLAHVVENTLEQGLAEIFTGKRR